nr:hypothetical protein [Tanacetum cinerariifolium]
MRTRSSSNLIVESFTILKRRNRRHSKQIVKPELRTSVETLVANMAYMRTMSKLLQAPTEGYGDAIVIPAILAENFELKVGLLSLVTSSQFHGFKRDDPRSHIPRTWLEKEPPRSIHTWEDLVYKFVNYFFPPSKTMNLKNDITYFQQRFDETFSEAWDRFKVLLRKCPRHNFLELHQIDIFYNALTQSDQDSLNAAAGGNLLNRTPRDALTIIKNKSKELVLMNKANQQAFVKAVEETCVTYGGPHPYYECLPTDSNTFNASAATGTYNQGGNGYRPQGDLNYNASNQMGLLGFSPPNVQYNQNYNRYNQNKGIFQASNNQGFNQQRGQNFNQGNKNYQAPLNHAQAGPSNDFLNYMKINDIIMRTMQNQISNMKTELKNEFKTTMLNQNNELKNMMSNEIKNNMNSFNQMQSPSGLRSLPSNTDVERETEATKDKVQTTRLESTGHVQPLVVQVPIPEPDVAPKPNPKPSIPYPSRLNDQKLREKTNSQMLKFF